MQDEIIRMAREAGLMQLSSCCGVPNKLCNLDVWQGNIQAFFKAAFKAGAAYEREACAKVCDEIVKQCVDDFESGAADECAAAIRARGDNAS